MSKHMMDSASSLAYFETLNILENFIHGKVKIRKRVVELAVLVGQT